MGIQFLFILFHKLLIIIIFSSTNIKIYLGYNFNWANFTQAPYYESEKVYIHPKFDKIPNRLVYDLALILMKQSINTSAGEHSICLPKKFEDKDVEYETYEYGMIAGWGPNQNESQSKQRLRIAELRIYQQASFVETRDDIAEIFKVDNQGRCGVSVQSLK